MDIYYGGDCLSYASFRHPIYRDYEKFPYGSWENQLNSPPKTFTNLQGDKDKTKEKTGGKKESCPFCREQKKRPLGAYLRRRQNSKHNDSICEEDEHKIKDEDNSSTVTATVEENTVQCQQNEQQNNRNNDNNH